MILVIASIAVVAVADGWAETFKLGTTLYHQHRRKVMTAVLCTVCMSPTYPADQFL